VCASKAAKAALLALKNGLQVSKGVFLNEFFTVAKTGAEISGYYHMSFLQGNPKCLPAGRNLS
jgi:hypothetical protein